MAMTIKKYRIEYQIIDGTSGRTKGNDATTVDAYNLKKAVDAFCIAHSNGETMFIMTKVEEIQE